MTRKPHSAHLAEFKEQAVTKAHQRGKRSVESVADELNMSVGTLKRWLKVPSKKASIQSVERMPLDGPTSAWNAAQRLQALLESFALSGPQLHAWCRENGVFERQLSGWRESFCSAATPESRESKAALRELQSKHELLQRELRRKERALAEAAALLVLQKKFRLLLEDEDR